MWPWLSEGLSLVLLSSVTAAVVSQWWASTRERRGAEERHLTEQIMRFYGPLSYLARRNEDLFDHYRDIHRASKEEFIDPAFEDTQIARDRVRDDHRATTGVANEYIDQDVFLNNEEIMKLLSSNFGLADPEDFERLCEFALHHARLKHKEDETLPYAIVSHLGDIHITSREFINLVKVKHDAKMRRLMQLRGISGHDNGRSLGESAIQTDTGADRKAAPDRKDNSTSFVVGQYKKGVDWLYERLWPSRRFIVRDGRLDEGRTESWARLNWMLSLAWLLLVLSWRQARPFLLQDWTMGIVVILTLWSAYRVYEVLLVQIKVVLLDHRPIHSYRRSVILLAHNFFEVAFWFAAVYALFEDRLRLSLGSFFGPLISSLRAMVDLSPISGDGLGWIVDLLAIVQGVVGLATISLCLAVLLSWLPRRESFDPDERPKGSI